MSIVQQKRLTCRCGKKHPLVEQRLFTCSCGRQISILGGMATIQDKAVSPRKRNKR